MQLLCLAPHFSRELVYPPLQFSQKSKHSLLYLNQLAVISLIPLFASSRVVSPQTVLLPPYALVVVAQSHCCKLLFPLTNLTLYRHYQIGLMRLAIILSSLFAIALSSECTQQLEIDCAIDIQRSVKFCAQAAETSGSDVIADIKCVEYLLRDKNACWPCICAEAKKKGWKVKGCNS